MTTVRTRAGTAPAWALLGVVALTACQDGTEPLTPDLQETPLTEAALDGTTLQVETQQESMFGDAERTRQRDRDRGIDRPAVDRVGLAVAFAGAAVELATETLRLEGADDRQEALLQDAEEYERAAVAALDAGDTGAAVRAAQAACWTALKAWILPGGITHEEATAVKNTATELLTQAAAAVGDDDGVRGLVLSWAVTFYTHGVEKLDAGELRGVAALWKSAVLSYWLLG